MKRLWILVLLFPLVTVGCKQEVGFSPTPNTPFNNDLGGGDDNGGGETPDPKGPVVKIMQAPSDHKLNKSTQVVFEVIPGDNELESVECYVDNEKVKCDWERGVFELEGLSLGKHEFAVVARDVEGLQGDAEEVWSIFQNFLKNQDLVNVEKGTQATDILFVIDNSSSMRY